MTTETIAAEAELARIEAELLAALARSRATHPELSDAPERLGLLAALRIVQGDRFGAPTNPTTAQDAASTTAATEGGVRR